MLLAIDIGNSMMKFGVFDGAETKDRFAIPTHRDYKTDELLFDRLRRVEEQFLVIDRVIVSSVAPEIENIVNAACRELFKVTPRVVDSTFDFRFAVKYDPPASLGTDRLVTAFAAASLYPPPLIVCSMGTATTVDVVNAANEFVGGMIAPGLGTLSEALHLKTSQLPQIQIKKPASVIGDTTVSSIRSGVFYGYVGLVSELIGRLKSEITTTDKIVADDISIIATGGFARLIAPEIPDIKGVEDDLVLQGLRRLAASADL